MSQSMAHILRSCIVAAGVTTVCDMSLFPPNEKSAWENLQEVYLNAAKDKQLAVRVQALVPLASR